MGEPSEFWRAYLSGESGQALRRAMRHLPSAPRCKICATPFKGPIAPILGLFGFGRWSLNDQLCRFCVNTMEKHIGGAEIEVSLLFSDVRGSTSLAETMTPTEMTSLLNDFFEHVAGIVDRHDGVIDHIVGDGVMAMWIPGFVGAEHPRHALAAGLEIASAFTGDPDDPGRLPVGVGAHTGTAYVGVVGSQASSRDFTVVGDVANTTARLGSVALAGELLATEAMIVAAGHDPAEYEERSLSLKGKSEAVAARAIRPVPQH